MEIQGGKFLTFLLGEEIYGLPIKKAREIIGMMETTYIPKMQSYIKGVINLRGKIVPIVDLRLRFEMAEKNYTERTCIIVIEVETHKNRRLVGIVVDAVSEVVAIQSGDIEPPPQYDIPTEGALLTGLGKTKEKIILILDIEKILNREELARLQQELVEAKS